MTVKEFVENNKDILIAPISAEEFRQLTDGCTVFCVTTSTGNKPIMDRAVKTAGYQMVVATTGDEQGDVVDICTLGLTKNGYAKIECITAYEIAKGNNKVLYHCKPLMPNDARKNHHWVY